MQDGELIVIPRCVEHLPVAHDEVLILLIEQKTTRNTAEEGNEHTIESQ